MKRLLNQSEKRRLLAIEILYEQRNWITLASLAKMLDCSVRVLKNDVAYFKKHFKDFTIESSNNGVRLKMRNNVGLKSLYQYALRHSTLLRDRKSTRLNSSHVAISYAVFCLKKKKKLF